MRYRSGDAVVVAITSDRGLLYACSQLVAGQPSCAGADFRGYDSAGHQVFSVRL